MTVADLIQGAFRVIGALAADEVPTASEQNNGFAALNDMLDSWAAERLTLFGTVRNTYTLTPGLNPHTIGSGGTFNTTWPVRVDRASIVLASSSNSELPLNKLSDAEWQITQGKTTSGLPVNLWVESAYPLAKLWLNPVPVNADTLVLYTWQQLGDFAQTSTAVDLPPGYKRALRYNLAKEIASEYGYSFPQEASDIAKESKDQLKRLNYRPGYLRSDMASRGRFNLISGDKG
jgi:hypothetical protein